MKSARSKHHDTMPLLTDASNIQPVQPQTVSAGNTPDSPSSSQTPSLRGTLAKVLRLFRSQSDPTVRPPSPPRRRTAPPRSASASPCAGSRQQSLQRRRYQRVLRNENAKPPDESDDNPFVTRKFTQEYLEKYYAEKRRRSDGAGHHTSPSSHTILKKSFGEHLPSDVDTASEPANTPTMRHAKFSDVVDIVEFGQRDRVGTGPQCTHQERLHDDDLDMVEVDLVGSSSEEGTMRNIFSSLSDHDVKPQVDRPPTKHIRLAGVTGSDVDKTESS